MAKPLTKLKKTSIIENTLWIIKLNFKFIPFFSLARFLGYVAMQAGNLLRSFIIGLIIDWTIKYTQNTTETKFLYYSLATYGAFYVFNGITGVLRNIGENMGNFKLNYEIPEILLHEKMNKLSTSALESPEVQNMVNRYRESMWTISSMTRGFINLGSMLIAFIISAITLFHILPVVTVLCILAAIPSLLVNKKVIDKLWQVEKETTVQSRRSGSIIYQLTLPEFLKEVKLINAYSYLKKFFDDFRNYYFKKRFRIYKYWSAFDLTNIFLTGSVILLGIYQLIGLISNGSLSLGQITFYIAALSSLGSYLDYISSNLSDYSGSNVRLTEMRLLLNYPEDNQANKKVLSKLTVPPLIKLNNVSFSYPGSTKKIIKNLNLEIKPGEKIAIVGENGAGKTTLVKLISNIYPVSSGEILINGENLNDINDYSWFQNLGVLYQDFNTYNDLTALENIALGRIDDEIDMKKITDAAQKADAINFINEYKEKFSQVLSEKYDGGIRPSTGQWQKIAIARFFYRNAPVLILDEPTASIDAVAEANIFNRIYKFIENKTVIIISHRFSTVRNADRIIVFDKGNIVEEGSHKTLLANNGLYANAFNLQAKGYNNDEE